MSGFDIHHSLCKLLRCELLSPENTVVKGTFHQMSLTMINFFLFKSTIHTYFLRNLVKQDLLNNVNMQ